MQQVSHSFSLSEIDAGYRNIFYMIGKRIILTIGGIAVLVVVTGFLLGSLMAEQELKRQDSNNPSLKY